MTGAICATVTFHRSENGERASSVRPNAPKRSASDAFTDTANVWIRPISSEAANAPDSEPSPPTTTTTNRIGPSKARHVGLGHERRARDHAGDGGERAAEAEYQHEHAGHIMPEHRDHVGMGQRRLDDQPTRVRVSTASKARKMPTRSSSMNSFVGRVVGGEDREGGESSSAGMR